MDEIIKVIAYSFHYLFSGFQKVLPWTRCDAWWNSANTKAECAIINSGELTTDQLNCRIANETDGLIRLVFHGSLDGPVTVFQNVDINRNSQFLEIKSNNCR